MYGTTRKKVCVLSQKIEYTYYQKENLNLNKILLLCLTKLFDSYTSRFIHYKCFDFCNFIIHKNNDNIRVMRINHDPINSAIFNYSNHTKLSTKVFKTLSFCLFVCFVKWVYFCFYQEFIKYKL